MKSLPKIQFLEMHLLHMKHPLHHKLLQNKKMKLQSRVLSPLYNLQLQMMMKMKSKCLQWATKDLSMRIVLMSPLPAKKAATGSLAGGQSGTRLPKGRGGGDLPKISAFPANAPQPRGRGPVREISLTHGLPVSQITQVRDPRVLPNVVEIAVQ